jgi:hypothetical protein
MIQELLDMLDETIQDLDEGGFSDEAEELYGVAYDTEWASEHEMVEEIGRGLLRVQARRNGDLPEPVLMRMARCLEMVRRINPDMSME